MSEANQIGIIVTLVLLVSTAGCTYPEATENSLEFSGTIERSAGQFNMDGDVHVDGTNDRDVEDIAIVLYDDTQSELKRVPVDLISSNPDGSYPSRQSVNITTDKQPEFVLIESPDAWNAGVPSEAYQWTGDHYTTYWVENEDDRFPSD
ncbi:hypothetical protein [Haloarcula sebkhae]|uniref:Uncharacterized protein n=2 Tax=Haloarcula sebkhae TaxID=932660 RepID=A0ACC6VLA1_9EURY|nr:hypothetical protein [Haloarcula sebkhae]GGK83771.1 hypothetical protein GCM10009067_39850 [Haloarcula sebkhae]